MIYLKRDATANVVLNNLYKHTPLQTSFGVNTVALVDGVPRTLNLAQLVTAYVDHQVEVITRRSEYRLGKAQRPGPHRRGPAQGARHDRRHHRPHPGLGRQVGGPRGAHGGALRVQRDPGRAHPRHAAEPADPPGQVRPGVGDGQAAGDDRRAGGNPGRRRAAAPGHQGRAQRGQGQARPAPAGRDHLRPGRHRQPRPHRRRGARRHHEQRRLHQDGGGRRLPHPGPRRPGRRRGQAARQRLRRAHRPHHRPRLPAVLLQPGQGLPAQGPRDPDEGAHGPGHRHPQPAARWRPTSASRPSSTPATTRPAGSCSSPPRRASSRRPSSPSTTRPGATG